MGQVLDFCSLLEKCGAREGGVFVDLGSGKGLAVLTAALAFPFRQVRNAGDPADCYGSNGTASDHSSAVFSSLFHSVEELSC